MGSNSSSRGTSDRMQNDSSDERVPSPEQGGEQDYVAILSYLLRSGQVRYIGAAESNESDVASNSDEEEDMSTHVCHIKMQQEGLASASERLNTQVLDKSDFKQHMQMQLGCLNQRLSLPSLKNGGNCARSLWAKEAGVLCKLQNVSPGKKIEISGPYLPNHGEPAARCRDKLFCGTYSKDGSIFLSACQDACLRLFRTKHGKLKLFKKIPAKDMGWSILDTDFSPGGDSMVYSSWSRYVHLCGTTRESDRHEALKVLPDYMEYGRTDAIFSVKFSGDGAQLLAGTNNGYIYVYDMERRTCINQISGHEDDVNSVAFEGSESNVLFSAGEDGLLKVWDRRTLSEDDPQPVGMFSGHRDSLVFVDPKSDGRYLITNSKDQSIKLWDMRVMSPRVGVQATRGAVAHQRWDYRVDTYRGNVTKPKLAGDVSLMTYYGHAVLRTLIRSRFSPQHTTGQRYIYSGCGHGRVIVYDLLTGKVLQELAKQKSVVRDVSWHPYENEILSSSWDGSVYRWDYRGLEDA